MKKQLYLTIVCLFVTAWTTAFAGVTLSGSTITQSGGSATNRDTPQTIIDAGYGTLIGHKVIRIENRDLTINGFYEDTGWTYVFSNNYDFYAGATCNWVSGEKRDGKYIYGAIFRLGPRSAASGHDLMANGATLFWYGVSIFSEGTTGGQARSRYITANVNSSSEVVLYTSDLSYLYNNFGDTALLEFHFLGKNSLRVGPNYGEPDKFVWVAAEDDATLLFFNKVYTGNPGYTAGDVVITGLEPTMTGTQKISFVNAAGTRRYILNYPTIELSRIRTTAQTHHIEFNGLLNIDLAFESGVSDQSGVAVHAFSGTHDFGLSSTSNASGEIHDVELTKTYYAQNSTGGTGDTGIDLTASQTITDRRDVDLALLRYDLNLVKLDRSNVGLEGKTEISQLMTTDNNITQTTKATVDAYTTIENLEKLYDRAKSWKVESANVEHPSLDKLLITANGKELDLDDYDLVVDKTAASAFSVDTTNKKITIKANELDDTDKFNVIETTGTVTTTNGATIDDGILVKDSNFTPSTAYDTSNATYIVLKSGFTEADLSGMKGLDGVTFTKVGDKTVYDIGDKGLWIEGALTIDCAKETITSKRADLGLRIRSTGSLTSNCFIDDGTDRLYLEEKIFSTTIPSGTANGRFYLDSGATLNMNGGWIETKDVASPEANTNLSGTIAYGVFGSYESNGDTAENQFRVHTNDWNITGTLVLIKMGFTVRQVQTIDINAIEARFSANAFFVSGSSPSVDVIFENVSILGDGDISRLWSNKRIIFPNAEKGTDYSVSPNSLNHGSSVGLVEFWKTVSPTIKDTSGSGIENVLIYVPYVDDGNRVDGNGHTYTTLESVSASTNSSGQLATPLEVFLGAYNETTYDATPDIFYMGKNGDNTDIFTFYFATYDKLIAQTDRELKGLNDLEFEWTLIDDLNITESTKATVDAYTEIDNLDKLYDRAKSWKVDSANIEHPSIGALLATADGATLDLDDHDLVIDASAASAFAVDKTNKKITIKASALATGTRFTGIKTTGTISTANSATIEFGYEDSTGINKFVHLDWGQSIIEHVSVINLDNNNAIIDNVSATQTFKDHFVMPSPAPTNGIRVEIKTPGGFRVFEEGFPEAVLNFIRLNVTLNASEERQGEMLFLARKLLQKSEGISEAVNGTTPTTNYSITTTTTGAAATNENQVAILQLLRRIMLKVSANKEALQKE